MSVLTAIKERLERPERGAAAATTTLRDLLIVTWAFPEEALRPLAPASLPLERLPGPDGEPVGLVQLTCALHEASRWAPLPARYGDSYHRADIRLLVRPGGRPAVLILRSYVSAVGIASAHFPLARAVEEARFALHVEGDPARPHYRRLSAQVSTDALQIQASVRAEEAPETTALGSWETLTPFLTQRPLALHEARLPRGGLTLVPTHLGPFTAQAGHLESARIIPLAGFDLAHPLAVHLIPEVAVTSYPPRPFRPADA